MRHRVVEINHLPPDLSQFQVPLADAVTQAVRRSRIAMDLPVLPVGRAAPAKLWCGHPLEATITDERGAEVCSLCTETMT